MKWLNPNDSGTNYEDRRGRIPRGAAVGGIGTIIALAIYLFTGQDLSPLIGMFGGGGQTTEETVDPSRAKENEDLKVFALRVFNSANDVWDKVLTEQAGMNYRRPTLVTYTEATTSDCGGASEAMGPFYCPGDEKVYLDLNFFHDLKTKFGAEGELAMAYVVAHEVGHHVQKLLGYTDKMQQMRSRLSETEYNQLSVRLELQADFLSGVWANYAQRMNIIQLEQGDVESALSAANAVGDDTIMKRSQGYVVPDAFTHGTSEQRMRWFMKGFQSGDLRQGDTFNTNAL